MNRSGRTYAIGIATALGIGVIGMYFILGGCEASKNRSCVGALLAITSAVAGDYMEECRTGACPKREDWIKVINADKPSGWTRVRKCPKGGTYSIEVSPTGELDSWKTYRVVCSFHGDLQKAKTLIDKATYDQLRNMTPIGTRPD